MANMNEVFELVGKVRIDSNGVVQSIEEISDKAKENSGKFGKFLSSMGETAIKVGKTIAKGMAVSATGISILTKGALDAYAEYEQLVGGVETLFKTSSDKVMEYANEAYKNQGMSANEYMETVTSFSASLLQGLGNDTDKAVEYANMAITDMSDNANKMGTDIESIQNAYQGFAKQNYTMLDNLKLGYGGTASEMVRLINDSGILEKEIKNLDNISFDQMVEAIHVVQTNMGITGTTALEASTTIQGSLSALKASWTNLTIGMADDTQDFDVLMGNFIDSAVTAFNNLLPRIETVFKSIPKLISGLAPQIAPLVTALLPPLIEATVALIGGLIDALPSILKALWDVLPLLLDGIIKILANILDKIIVMLSELGVIVKNALNNVGEIIKSKVDNIVASVKSKFTSMRDNVSSIFSKIKTALTEPFETAKTKIKSIIDTIKSFFNFKWSLPKISLPHFAVSPKGWKIGDLLKGSIPKLSIDWYAKGGILNSPTIFGIGENGNLLGGGEKGAEAVAPISDLQDYVRIAVDESNVRLEERLSGILSILSDYLPQMNNMQLVLDTGALVGEIASPIDAELGTYKRRRDR